MKKKNFSFSKKNFELSFCNDKRISTKIFQKMLNFRFKALTYLIARLVVYSHHHCGRHQMLDQRNPPAEVALQRNVKLKREHQTSWRTQPLQKIVIFEILIRSFEAFVLPCCCLVLLPASTRGESQRIRAPTWHLWLESSSRRELSSKSANVRCAQLSATEKKKF